MIKSDKKPIHVKPSFYAITFEPLKEIAFKYGYNLVLHGSLNRDMDLIGIPWSDILRPHKEMVEEFNDYLGGELMVLSDEQMRMPAGRLSYIINLNRGGAFNNYVDEQYYLDISITK